MRLDGQGRGGELSDLFESEGLRVAVGVAIRLPVHFVSPVAGCDLITRAIIGYLGKESRTLPSRASRTYPLPSPLGSVFYKECA